MKEEAVFGGGCFWCTEAAFRLVDGVIEVVSGYAGGSKDNPLYKEVVSGETGHAEVVKVTFDTEKVSYLDLLKVFFTIHDPTTLNKQGNDFGTQYRSIILYKSEEQKKIAIDYILNLQERGEFLDIVTKIEPLDVFWPAEEYHQHYYEKHPEQGYCQLIIRPKLNKLMNDFD